MSTLSAPTKSIKYFSNHFASNSRNIKLAFKGARKNNKRAKQRKTKTARKDPLWVDGERPRPMYVDYKDVELLKKLTNRHGRIVGRRKTGCSAASQNAVKQAIKRARFLALMPYVGDWSLIADVRTIKLSNPVAWLQQVFFCLQETVPQDFRGSNAR